MKKAIIPYILAAAVVSLGLLTKACSYRYRQAELTVASSDVEARFAQIEALVNQDGFAPYVSAMKALRELYNQGAALYYAEAPGTMGSIENVMPFEFSALLSQGKTFGALKQAYVIYVLSKTGDGYRGGLIIAGDDGISPTGIPTATPTPTLSPSPTGSQAPAPSGAITFYFVAVNTAQTPAGGTQGSSGQSLAPGAINDGEFLMQLNLKNEMSLWVRSLDIVDDTDLGDVIQLEVYKNSYGSNNFIGLLNLAIPK